MGRRRGRDASAAADPARADRQEPGARRNDCRAARARYLLLETIREFALEQARAEGEEDAVAPAALCRLPAALPHRRIAVCAGRRRQPGWRAWNPNRTTCAPPCSGRLTKSAMRTWRGCCLPPGGSGSTSATGMSWAGGSRELLPHREALDADLRLALLINFCAVARAVGRVPADRSLHR